MPEDDVSDIISGMFGVVDREDAPGLGLAANQVGYTKQIIVINCSGFRAAIINPKIERLWGGTATSSEGCLSAPGKRVRLTRFKRANVTGLDENMEPVSYKTKGITARVIQHEIDHMTGITIFDRKRLGLFA